jgi:hypothetical protein
LDAVRHFCFPLLRCVPGNKQRASRGN